MSGWLLSIVGIALLSLLIEIILPEGKTSKYVKGVFAIITVTVIIAPLVTLFNKDVTPQSFLNFDTSQTSITYDQTVVNTYSSNVKQAITDSLEKKGIYGTDIVIIFDTDDIYLVKSVYVTAPIDSDSAVIVDCVRKKLSVKKEQIYVNGFN